MLRYIRRVLSRITNILHYVRASVSVYTLAVLRVDTRRMFIRLNRVCRLNLSREKAVFPYLTHSSYLRLALVALHVSRTDLRILRVVKVNEQSDRLVRKISSERYIPLMCSQEMIKYIYFDTF